MVQSRISDILKSLRTEKGYSQKQLAEILNVAQNTVSNWENGTREPDLPTITKLANHFEVSTDYLLYGFDKSGFTSIVNLARYRRSIKEFSNDTGIDEFYLNRLCSGIVYEQPPIEIVEKIANSNQNDWLVDRESIFKAAGYVFSEPVYDGPISTPEEAFGGENTYIPQNEIDEILETLHKRPEMKVLFSATKNATKEDIEKAVKIIEALKDK